MIRSLVFTSNMETIDAGIAESLPTDANKLRRNLTRDQLEKCLTDGNTMWIDIVSPEAEEIGWLKDWLELSPTVVTDLRREDRRPTLLVYPHYLFLSLFQPIAHSKSIIGKEIHCIIGDNFCITVRPADTSALEDAYDRVAKNPDSWNRTVAYFLHLITQHVIDTYYPLLDRISIQLNTLEEKFLNDNDDKHAQKSVYRIKQQLSRLRQMISPQREVLSNLIGEQRVSGNSDFRDLFRHLYERLLGIYDVIDSQRDSADNVLEIISDQQSRKMGEAVNRLTIISMVFLPFTFFLGMFDSDFFVIGESVTLPMNGLVISAIVTVLMILSIFIIRKVFQRRGWM